MFINDRTVAHANSLHRSLFQPWLLQKRTPLITENSTRETYSVMHENSLLGEKEHGKDKQ